MKILHSADWHLDSPLQGHTPAQMTRLRKALLEIPGKVAAICRSQGCDMMLLSGDLFDGPYTRESLDAVRRALKEAAVPVFVTPGNHDFAASDSPWLAETWPENVHIFTRPVMEMVELPALDCRVYGAGFTAMDCPGLLKDFQAEPGEGCAIGILHGDPTQVSSPYCPVTKKQVEASGLAYLALGHIHKGGSFRAGDTLCAWPGCPMGRGYDEQGEKGLLIVTVADTVSTQFVSLDTPRFYDLEVEPEDDGAGALNMLLPPVENEDFYRVTFVGESQPMDIPDLTAQFSRFPNLLLRDKTTPPTDLWGSAGEDNFEGMYFRLLRESMEGLDPEAQKQIRLAARISRKILDGQEVHLP